MYGLHQLAHTAQAMLLQKHCCCSHSLSLLRWKNVFMQSALQGLADGVSKCSQLKLYNSHETIQCELTFAWKQTEQLPCTHRGADSLTHHHLLIFCHTAARVSGDGMLSNLPEYQQRMFTYTNMVCAICAEFLCYLCLSRFMSTLRTPPLLTNSSSF